MAIAALDAVTVIVPPVASRCQPLLANSRIS